MSWMCVPCRVVPGFSGGLDRSGFRVWLLGRLGKGTEYGFLPWDASRGMRYWFAVAVEVCSGGGGFGDNLPLRKDHLFSLPQATTSLGLAMRTNNGRDVYPLPVQIKTCGQWVLAQKLLF